MKYVIRAIADDSFILDDNPLIRHNPYIKASHTLASYFDQEDGTIDRELAKWDGEATNGAGFAAASGSTVISATKDQTLEVRILQSEGTSTAIDAGPNRNWVAVEYLGK